MNNQTPSVQPSDQKNPTSSAFDYKNWREGFILTILRIACVLGVALIASSFSTATISDRILFIGLYLALLLITVLRVNYMVRAFTLLFMVFVIGLNSILAWGPWLDGSVFFIAFIALSALLFDQRVDIGALFISIFTFALIAILQQLGSYQFKAPNVPPTTLVDWVGYIIDFSIISAILVIAINQLKREFTNIAQGIQNTFETLSTERARLEDKVREHTEELETRSIQLRSSAAISRTITEMQNVSDLLETTTRLISDQFGYFHVGLYLFDERQKNAFLQASSSGNLHVGDAIRVEPNRLNPINQVIERKRPYIISNVHDTDFMHGTNFLLTHSRMVLPLTVRNNVIGFLDIHSENPHSFNTQNSEVLQTLADLTAISIDNVRLINETKNLVNQLETNLSDQTLETWTKFTSHHKPGYQYTPAGVRPLFANSKLDNLDGLRVPLMLHGQRIGNIVLKRKGSVTEWSERERILVEKVASQVALALENSRLVDESQKSAMRDQMIANISARVRETLDIDSVLRTATTELRRVFDLKEAEVSIGISPAENAPVKKHTSQLRFKSGKD
jgi:GAF domain-containing protein